MLLWGKMYFQKKPLIDSLIELDEHWDINDNQDHIWKDFGNIKN